MQPILQDESTPADDDGGGGTLSGGVLDVALSPHHHQLDAAISGHLQAATSVKLEYRPTISYMLQLYIILEHDTIRYEMLLCEMLVVRCTSETPVNVNTC